MRRLLIAVLSLSGCAGGNYPAGSPVPSIAMTPEDRVLLGDFSRVTAIAASYDRVYVGYGTAVGIYRTLERKWDVPRTPRDPTLLQTVVAGTIDPLDQSLWLATTTGWIHYQPDIDRWDAGAIASRVTGLATDPNNPGAGIWFRTNSGWMLQPRVGPAMSAAPPAGLIFPPSINDAFADIPQLRSLAPQILTGPLMRQGNFTAAVPNAQRTGWYLGTSNRGLLFFDRTAIEAQPMRLGLPGNPVGAIATTADGIWVVNDLSITTPSALTFLSEDLGTSTGITGSAAFGLPFDAARQVVPTDSAIWIGTEKGLVRVELADGKITRWDTPQGMPDSRITALAQANGRIVAGTLRGLVEVGTDDKLRRRTASFDWPVYAFKANGDTLWVGTSRGLYALLQGDDSLRMPEGFRQVGVIPPVLGIGYVVDTLVALTPDHLLWRDPHSGAWTRGPDLGATLGQLTAFATSADGIWVGGTRGAGLVRPTTPLLHPQMVGGELPAQVTSIAASDRYLWIGTQLGLVRVRFSGR